jgi:hypothetical protein
MTNLKPKGHQTAVEWVFDKMSNVLAGNSSVTTQEILEHGLAMHREQIEQAWMDAEDNLLTEESAKFFAEKYYNKTYKVVEEEGDGIMPEEPVESYKDKQWFIDMVNEDAKSDAEYYGNDSYERADVPEYIVASTSYDARETYVFEATADGKIITYDDYGGLAERWGDTNWYNPEAAVKSCMPNTYHAVSSKGNSVLFKIVTPDECTYFDGDESDRISY